MNRMRIRLAYTFSHRLPVVHATERDGELVARFAPERPRLYGPEMMGLCGLTTAKETRLLGNKAQVRLSCACDTASIDAVDAITRRCGSITLRKVTGVRAEGTAMGPRPHFRAPPLPVRLTVEQRRLQQTWHPPS